MNRKMLKRAFVSLEYVLISSILVVGMIFIFKTTQQDSSQVVGVGVDNVNRVLHLGADRPHLKSIKDKQQDIFEIQVDREVEDPSGTKTMTEKIQEFFANLLARLGSDFGDGGSENIQQGPEIGEYYLAGHQNYRGHYPNVNEVIGFWEDEITVTQQIYFPVNTAISENKKVTVENINTFTFSEDGKKAVDSNGVEYQLEMDLGKPLNEYGYIYGSTYGGPVGNAWYSFSISESGKVTLQMWDTLHPSDITYEEDEAFAKGEYFGRYSKEDEVFITKEGFTLQYIGAAPQ